MPIPYLLELALQIALVVHAVRTGRNYYWIMILMFVPVAGSIAYIIIEILPGAGSSPASRQAMSNAKRIVNPEGEYRRLADQLELTPTIANKRALADECVRLGRLDEAEGLFRETLVGMHATDPFLMLGLARVQLGRGDWASCLQTLDAIKHTNPDFQDAGAYMLYARALEGLGRDREALAEYDALSRYFGGEEPKVRRALLLQRLGQAELARQAFQEVTRSVDRAPRFYRRNQQEWYRLARQGLRE